MIIQAVRRLIVPAPAPAMPQRRAFLRGLLAAGGTAAVAPLLLPVELANLDDVLMDLHGRRTVDMGASSVTYDDHAWGQEADYLGLSRVAGVMTAFAGVRWALAKYGSVIR